MPQGVDGENIVIILVVPLVDPHVTLSEVRLPTLGLPFPLFERLLTLPEDNGRGGGACRCLEQAFLPREASKVQGPSSPQVTRSFKGLIRGL